MRLEFIVLTVILLSSTATAITVYSEDLGVNDPLYVESCSPVNISCEGSELINENNINRSCSVYAYNVSMCGEEITVSTNETEKTVRKAPFKTSAENTQHNNSAVSLAKKVYAAHITNQSYDEEINQLIMQRNETSKCWPETECRLSKTSEVLLWLSRADFNRSNRVYDDSLNYVEAQQNQFENEDWSIFIDTRRTNTTCEVTRGDTTVHNGEVGNGSNTYTFTYRANERLRVECESDFSVEVRNDIDTLQDRDFRRSDESYNYFLPGGCWPEDDTERICNSDTTANALGLHQLDEDQYSEGEDWVEAQIQRGEITGERLANEENIILHSRLYEATQNDEIRQWLLFSQNNDGSFADRDETATLEVLNAIRDSSEWIQDGRSWIQENRPREGYNTLRDDSLLYSVFQASERELRVEPPILRSEGEDIEFKIYGEITEDTEFHLTNTIPGNLTIEENTGTIAIGTISPGYISGSLIIQDETTRKIPVILSRDAEISLDIDEELYVQAREGQLRAQAEIPRGEECQLTSTRIIHDRNITSSGPITLEYSLEEEGQYSSTLNMTCDTPTGIQTEIQQVDITYYEQPPFTLSISNEEIETIEHIYIENNIPEDILTINEFETQPTFYSLPTTTEIPIGKTAKIPIYQRVEHTENFTEENTVRVQSLGYEDSLDLSILIDGEMQSFEEEYEITEQSNLLQIAMVSLLIITISIGGYTGYTYLQRQNEDRETESEDEKAEEDLEQKETEKALGEIELGIEKIEGRESKEDLKEQGYSDTEIEEIEGLLEKLVEEK